MKFVGSVYSVAATCALAFMFPSDSEVTVDVDDDSFQGAEQIPTTKRPKMGVMDVTRIMACWSNPDVIKDEPCMEWMTKICPEQSSHLGLCGDLEELLKTECAGNGENKDRACKYQQEMKVQKEFPKPVSTDDQRSDEDAEAEAEADKVEKELRTPASVEETTVQTTPPTTSAPPSLPPCDPTITAAPETVAETTPSPPADSVETTAAAAEGNVEAEVAGQAAARTPPVGYTDTGDLSKQVPHYGLPAQGFHHGDAPKEWVKHQDQNSQTEDWGNEWPSNSAESETVTMEKICMNNPELRWCRNYLSHQRLRREAMEPKEADGGWFR